jgi:hypothetical protein
MELVKNEFIDWEPHILTLVFPIGTPIPEALPKIIRDWELRRNSVTNCQCALQYLQIITTPGSAICQIHCEKACDKCLPLLFRRHVQHPSSGNYSWGNGRILRSHRLPDKRRARWSSGIISETLRANRFLGGGKTQNAGNIH